MQQQHARRLWRGMALLGAVVTSSVSAGARAQPDNTRVNKRNRTQGAVTADQQKENGRDRAITQKIRKSLMADTHLSTYAHNVKIVAMHGEVTLEGPVRSEDEKTTVEDRATAVVGAGRVVNQLSVAPSSRN